VFLLWWIENRRMRKNFSLLWQSTRRYPLRLLPVWVLILLIMVFLLSGWVSMFPPGESYLLPLRRFYDGLGAFTLRLTSVICLSALPVAVVGIVWVARRFSKEEIWQDDIVIAYWLATILGMVAVFLVPLVISTALLPAFTYPGYLTEADTTRYRYVLDVHEGSAENPDTYILHQCDLNGVICQRVLTIDATRTNGWNRDVWLEPDGDVLRVRSGERTIHVEVPDRDE